MKKLEHQGGRFQLSRVSSRAIVAFEIHHSEGAGIRFLVEKGSLLSATAEEDEGF
jgi:hypothetical protein